MYYEMGKVNIEFRNLSLQEIVSSAVKRVLGKTEFLGQIEFNLNCNTRIYADEDSSIKMFYYIVENAMNYSEINRKILIIEHTLSNRVEIEIKDEGFGIPDQQLDKLFDKSENIILSKNGMSGNSGWGLILAKQLSQINNATIRIQSKENEGTSVFVGYDTKETN
jgi:signal transduction histidine kinase